VDSEFQTGPELKPQMNADERRFKVIEPWTIQILNNLIRNFVFPPEAE
jgi:hypothetical protein